MRRQWLTTAGIWEGSTALAASTYYHVAVVYNGDSILNDPAFYVNGVAETVTEIQAPVGTLSDDAGQSLVMGESGGGSDDVDGRIGWFVYDSTLWDAAAVNRAMWWGRPNGGVAVYHPLVTAKLVNEGTATATGSVTGTTVAAFATPVVRPGTAMLGMGVGW
jgi:hypothetical protein